MGLIKYQLLIKPGDGLLLFVEQMLFHFMVLQKNFVVFVPFLGLFVASRPHVGRDEEPVGVNLHRYGNYKNRAENKQKHKAG